MSAESSMERMRRVAARQSAEAAAAPVSNDRPASKRPAVFKGASEARPTRITVDLDADRYRVLRVQAVELDTKQAAVIRALLDELAADPSLAQRVALRIAGS